MSKIIATILLVTVTMVSLTALASTTTVSSTDLIEKAKELDGQEVLFTGEVIGDIMVRGDYTWINVSDGVNSVGIWVQNQDMQGITLPGRYGIHGDDVSITGIFRRACPEHGGDLDIHAAHAQLVKKGYHTAFSISPWKIPAAAALMLAVSILFAYKFKKQRRHS